MIIYFLKYKYEFRPMSVTCIFQGMFNTFKQDGKYT